MRDIYHLITSIANVTLVVIEVMALVALAAVMLRK